MYLQRNWRVLTVGDGDLTFTKALLDFYPASQLHGSVYDSETTLRDKYQHHGIDALRAAKVSLDFEFDVTATESWQRLGEKRFDLVIFQFPLLSQLGSEQAFAAAKQNGGLNILNRALLHQYLLNSARYALAPQGAGLCYITSKDVKPYSHWGLDHALTSHTPVHFLGEQQFDLRRFPGYKVRNVDRDKHVKDTLGITYTYALNADSEISAHCHRRHHLDDPHCCLLCRAGPFQSERDREGHLNSKQHRHMQGYDSQWQRWLADFHKNTD
ncbi:Rossmann-like fold-containing protein [Pseudoalteromonas sp. T1lg76]|uniref:Rossmann-like fold-containing protein n=1 Tax=Pseudoalteromonas sp. T1lg76 TaxID=2077103 RepID=UPI000CF5EF8F|nr:Rossmann-like fold-containing protein [Pseudoalteromonas sp. T1lg76]